ncbi:hypothetical protein AGLY_001746 [Aphis glycines]|uniref:Uncharacterized protein n=1 Tax=Aphis glycines TaxID=307491 RepID=A0A6G0U527_APHGL|nr:hypothetical protein AGLY_001746 [Aphis glycines]
MIKIFVELIIITYSNAKYIMRTFAPNKMKRLNSLGTVYNILAIRIHLINGNNIVFRLFEKKLQLIYHFVVYINTKNYTFKCKTCYVTLHYYNNLLLQFTYILIIKDKLTYKQNYRKISNDIIMASVVFNSYPIIEITMAHKSVLHNILYCRTSTHLYGISFYYLNTSRNGSLSCVFVFKTNFKNERLLLQDTYKTFTLRYFNETPLKNNNWKLTSSKIANIKTNLSKLLNVKYRGFYKYIISHCELHIDNNNKLITYAKQLKKVDGNQHFKNCS